MTVADWSDLLFSNIKHLFFQPSEKELMVLIHINLKAPIMLGKKKTSVSCVDPRRSERKADAIRTSNSTEKSEMPVSTKQVAKSVERVMGTKMRSSRNRRTDVEGESWTKCFPSSLSELSRPHKLNSTTSRSICHSEISDFRVYLTVPTFNSSRPPTVWSIFQNSRSPSSRWLKSRLFILNEFNLD